MIWTVFFEWLLSLVVTLMGFLPTFGPAEGDTTAAGAGWVAHLLLAASAWLPLPLMFTLTGAMTVAMGVEVTWRLYEWIYSKIPGKAT